MTWTATTPDGDVTWSAGRLTGARAAVLALEANLPGAGSIAVTPTGPFVPSDTRNPLAVVAALAVLYRGRFTLSCDAPSLDFGAPDDAVF